MAGRSIRDEIVKLGTLGPSAYALLVQTFVQEIKKFRGLGDLHSAEDLALEFFADRADSYPQAIAATHDDDAAARLTHRWARNWLVDKTRSLPLGALRNRLEKRLERSPLFERSIVAHHWKLVDSEDADTDATRPELQRIASQTTVHVQPTRLDSDSSQRLGRPGELEHLLANLLESAGRLHISDITSICAERFPTVLETGDALLGAYNLDDQGDNDPALGTLDKRPDKVRAVVLDAAARQLLSHLPDRLRTVLIHIHDVAAVEEQLGVGRSAAYNAIADTKARVIELAGEVDAAPELLRRVFELVVDESADVSSHSNEQLSKEML